MITKTTCERFFELLGEIVNNDQPYMEKKRIVLQNANDTDKITLSEFVGWFSDDDDWKA